MDAVWTALDKHKPCRLKEYDPDVNEKTFTKKVLDWMTM